MAGSGYKSKKDEGVGQPSPLNPGCGSRRGGFGLLSLGRRAQAVAKMQAARAPVGNNRNTKPNRLNNRACRFQLNFLIQIELWR
jgi:glycyl-tRNA synthetase alpha subunit